MRRKELSIPKADTQFSPEEVAAVFKNGTRDEIFINGTFFPKSIIKEVLRLPDWRQKDVYRYISDTF